MRQEESNVCHDRSIVSVKNKHKAWWLIDLPRVHYLNHFVPLCVCVCVCMCMCVCVWERERERFYMQIEREILRAHACMCLCFLFRQLVVTYIHEHTWTASLFCTDFDVDVDVEVKNNKVVFLVLAMQLCGDQTWTCLCLRCCWAPAHRMCGLDRVEKAIFLDRITEDFVPWVFSGQHCSVFKTNQLIWQTVISLLCTLS